MLRIAKDEKIILIRYSDMFGYDTIQEHINIINNLGYCYFGKVGKKTSSMHLKELLESKEPKIILNSKKAAYIAIVDDIVFEKPENGYPKYYENELFSKNNYPSMYYRLKNILKFDKKYFSSFVVNSSINPLPQALNQSMTSQLLVRAEQNINLEEDE